MTEQRRRFHVRGQVQGVGFRPYVHRLAGALDLAGFVANDRSGAVIEVQGPGEVLDIFAERLMAQLPPLADITTLSQVSVPAEDGAGFQIRQSNADGVAKARVTVDATVCDDCLAEMWDPADRRYRYPFINCTNCGPRYTIVERIPYDRPNTTMREFAMCDACRTEYEDPASRRFHAQPIACPTCGPRVWLTEPDGVEIASDDAIGEAITRLVDGQILAIKGLGGFHLACRADRDEPVAELRRRKRRDAKPFAVMVADADQAAGLAVLDEAALSLLTGVDRPIVLAPKRSQAIVSQYVAPGVGDLGLMLPYTPLHCLLMAGAKGPLVMTSGNLTDEPLAKDNDEAVERLGGLCDAMLVHDRRIERRVDDAVVQADGGAGTVLRRSRGHVPGPVRLSQPVAMPILAVGAELKSTICLARDDQAVLSEHIGDLTDTTVYRQFVRTVDHFCGLVETAPAVIAHDLHPQYLSTAYARQRSDLPRVAVQHHWAHAASCMAEHALAGPVIGVVCDGTGYGTDGTVWGCEILRADYDAFERVGHLKNFPLPGGDAAARSLHRTVLGVLWHTFGSECVDLEMTASVCPDATQRAGLVQMLENDVNCPETSSLGRLFDAVACMSGVADCNTYEGQAPMALEAIADANCEDWYPYAIEHHGRDFELDVRPMVSAILADVRAGRAASIVSATFHNTVVQLLKSAAVIARDITDLSTVVLSGGCFANRWLRLRLAGQLESVGMDVWTHRRVPCNDGGVALGQAVIAAAMMAAGKGVVGEVYRVSGCAGTD